MAKITEEKPIYTKVQLKGIAANRLINSKFTSELKKLGINDVASIILIASQSVNNKPKFIPIVINHKDNIAASNKILTIECEDANLLKKIVHLVKGL